MKSSRPPDPLVAAILSSNVRWFNRLLRANQVSCDPGDHRSQALSDWLGAHVVPLRWDPGLAMRHGVDPVGLAVAVWVRAFAASRPSVPGQAPSAPEAIARSLLSLAAPLGLRPEAPPIQPSQLAPGSLWRMVLESPSTRAPLLAPVLHALLDAGLAVKSDAKTPFLVSPLCEIIRTAHRWPRCLSWKDALQLVTRCLEAGADVHEIGVLNPTHTGGHYTAWQPLGALLYSSFHSGDKDLADMQRVMEILLENGADPHRQAQSFQVNQVEETTYPSRWQARAPAGSPLDWVDRYQKEEAMVFPDTPTGALLGCLRAHVLGKTLEGNLPLAPVNHSVLRF